MPRQIPNNNCHNSTSQYMMASSKAVNAPHPMVRGQEVRTSTRATFGSYAAKKPTPKTTSVQQKRKYSLCSSSSDLSSHVGSLSRIHNELPRNGSHFSSKFDESPDEEFNAPTYGRYSNQTAGTQKFNYRKEVEFNGPHGGAADMALSKVRKRTSSNADSSVNRVS